MSQGKGENQLWTGGQQLWSQTLEERGHTFVGGHVLDDGEPGFVTAEILVLDSGLDDVQRSRDNQGGRSTANGGHEVLAPGGRGVVIQMVDVFLGKGGTTEKSEGARRVSGHGPAPTVVERETLVLDDLQEPSTLERLWVCLSLDLQDVQRQEDNLTNTDKGPSGRGKQGLPGLGAEGVVEVLLEVPGQELLGDRLTPVLVDSLQDLVAGGVSQPWEQGEESLAE